MSRRRMDLTNRRFGSLTAVAPTEGRKHGAVVWQCRCDCGNEALIPGRELVKGSRKSCGCRGRKDLTGQKFGRLTVVEYRGKRELARYWLCKCDCGEETEAAGTLLRSGRVRSCGCLRREARKQNLEKARKQVPKREAPSGHTGVYQNKRNGKWIAQITQGRKNRYIGSFDSLEEAARFRDLEEQAQRNG